MKTVAPLLWCVRMIIGKNHIEDYVPRFRNYATWREQDNDKILCPDKEQESGTMIYSYRLYDVLGALAISQISLLIGILNLANNIGKTPSFKKINVDAMIIPHQRTKINRKCFLDWLTRERIEI